MKSSFVRYVAIAAVGVAIAGVVVDAQTTTRADSQTAQDHARLLQR